MTKEKYSRKIKAYQQLPYGLYQQDMYDNRPENIIFLSDQGTAKT